MRNETMAAALLGAALPLLLTGGACAQSIHVLRPAHNAIVRETVPVKVSPGDLPADGYASVSIDGKFRTALALSGNRDKPVYLWNTKSGGDGTVNDGEHTIQITIFREDSHLVGTDTIPVHVANAITNIPPGGVHLAYNWPSQRSVVYRRETSLKVAATDAAPGATNPVLQEAQLAFTRNALDPTPSAGLIRDLVVSGTVTSQGQPQEIVKSYNVQPLRRTVSARGIVLGSEEEEDYMDHIGFPIPELPNKRRVDRGDSWQSPAVVALNWDGSSAAHVTAECRLEGFEWQDNYPTAKIRETYTGPARFVPQPASVSGHAPPPPISASSITFERILYFAYGSGRLVKSVTNTQVTLTAAQSARLGAAAPAPSGYRGGPPPGFQGGPPPGYQGGPPPGYPGGPPAGYPGPGGDGQNSPGDGPDVPGQSPYGTQSASQNAPSTLLVSETTSLQTP